MASNGTTKSEYGTPAKVVEVCESMQLLEDARARDRAQIDILFNGQRPYSDKEAKDANIEINVNWGEGKRIITDAAGQINNALLHPGYLFSCNLESGKVDKRDEWSASFTKLIHKPLQRGRSGQQYYFRMRSRNASVALHGIGPLMWKSDYKWSPQFVGLEDLLIPTDTLCDLSNMGRFAQNLYLSPGEFADLTQGEKTDRGWDQKACKEILSQLKDMKIDPSYPDWYRRPEAVQELSKQNAGWLYSDALPKVELRAFYYKDVESGMWYRHIVLRRAVGTTDINKFLYDGSDKVFANNINHILHVQYGDNSIVPPNKYHSVRGLGVDLYAPVETLNRLRCQYVQSVFEHLAMYFKIRDPADRDRLKSVVLQRFGFIPDGLEIVPREQRHQIDPRLVDDAMSQMRQIMQESSSSYVQDVNDGTSKERTAFEARAMLNQATVMVSRMLSAMYMQETYHYEEIVRRFLRKDSPDAQVKAFQKSCLEAGIPENLLKPEVWHIVPERVLGGGDRTQAQNQAQFLLGSLQLMDPVSQTKAKRIAFNAILEDPAKALMLIPNAPVTATDGSMMAEQLFGTLMQGIDCAPRQGIDQQGYVEKLLMMMTSVVGRIKSTDNMATIEELAGLQTCAKNVQEHIQIIAQDPNEQQRVKQYSDVLGKLTNELKGFAQRLMEQQQSQQPEVDQESQAKAQAIMMQTEAKLKSHEATTVQKLESSQAKEMQKLANNQKKFEQQMRQDFERFQLDQQKAIGTAQVDAMSKATKTAVEVQGMKKKEAAKPKQSV